MREERVLGIVFERANGFCEKCGGPLGEKYYYEIRNKRLPKNNPINRIVVCCKCHVKNAP
jgi:hypothetical protein